MIKQMEKSTIEYSFKRHLDSEEIVSAITRLKPKSIQVSRLFIQDAMTLRDVNGYYLVDINNKKICGVDFYIYRDYEYFMNYYEVSFIVSAEAKRDYYEKVLQILEQYL